MTPQTARRSPQLGRYLVTNRAWNLALRATDGALVMLMPPGETSAVSGARRILIAVGGHRGDAVIASAALEMIRRRAPAAQLGIVAGSWASDVLAGQPNVEWIHTLDHWRVNRSPRSLVAKMTRYVSSFTTAVRAVRAIRYDLAIDLYPFYPNMAGLLWRADIPRRVGFTSGGHGALYTHRLDWVDDRAHIAMKHRQLIDVALGVAMPESSPIDVRYTLAPVADRERASADSKLATAGASRTYVVLHAGSGERVKEWPLASWRVLANHLVEHSFSLVVTGNGEDEVSAARWLASEVPGCVSVAGELTWNEFVHVLSGARLSISGDTVAAHVAAAVGTPCVVLFSGINDMREWRPLGSAVVELINAVPCAPCFRGNGCATMSCVRGIQPDVVARQALELLASHP